MNAPLRSLVVATTLIFAGALPASARLIEYTVDGYFVSYGPYSWGPFGARFTTVFDGAIGPIESTETSATYAAQYGTVTYLGGERDGETEFVYGITLRITADPVYGNAGYAFTGVTDAGWHVWHVEYADDLAFVPDFALPLTDPLAYLTKPDTSIHGDVTIDAPMEGWSAFTDNGAFFNVRFLPKLAGLPVIVRQPSLGHVRLGKSLKLEVRVRSHLPVVFQWLKDSLPIPGETSSTLRIKHTTRDDAGIYRVLIRNERGIVVSRPVVVEFGCHSRLHPAP